MIRPRNRPAPGNVHSITHIGQFSFVYGKENNRDFCLSGQPVTQPSPHLQAMASQISNVLSRAGT